MPEEPLSSTSQPFSSNAPLSHHPVPSAPLNNVPVHNPTMPSAPMANPPIAEPTAPSPVVLGKDPTGFPSSSDYIPPSANGTVIQPPDPALAATLSKGANWFFWIVGLSIINAFLMIGGSEYTMAVGTNATLLVDAGFSDYITNYHGNSALRIVEFGLDFLILGFYAFCGLNAAKGKVWAFWLGGIAFVLDTCLFVFAFMPIGFALHAWALISIFMGLGAAKKLIAYERSHAMSNTPWAA